MSVSKMGQTRQIRKIVRIKMNLRQPLMSLREFYDFDAKFVWLDRYVMWPSIRLVVSIFPAFASSCVCPSSVS